MTSPDQSRPVWNRFIVLEGLDGAGTTTQARILAERLQRGGSCADYTFEPTDWDVGSTIRRLLATPTAARPGTMAYLFAADRYEHLYRPDTGIKARLDSGCFVVTDRYLFSSLAYQGSEYGTHLPDELNRGFPLPEHLIFLDVPVSVAVERLGVRSAVDRYENEAFQRSVKQRYEEIIGEYRKTTMKIHVINGTEAQETVAAAILAAIDRDSS